MAYAVELMLDENSAAEIRKVWERLGDAGITTSMIDRPFQPHLTLAVFDEIRRPDYVKTVSEFARQTAPLDITLPNFGIFQQQGVVFLGATVTWKLIELHEWFHEALKNYVHQVWEYYLPGSWVPHVTLASDLELSLIPKAIEVCQTLPLPFNAQVIAIAVVDTTTGEQIQYFPLSEK